jgi:hypothetical protein
MTSFLDLFAGGKGSAWYADMVTLAARLTTVTNALEGLAVTSSSSVTPATGALAFTTDQTATDRPLAVGATVRARSAADPSKYVVGTVTAFSGTALSINATIAAGSGAVTDWVIAYEGAYSMVLALDPAPKLAADLDANGKSVSGILDLTVSNEADLQGLVTVRAGLQSKALFLGDVSGEVVIEAVDPLEIYCTIVGDTTFLVAGGTLPGYGHQHLIHWTMGGAGGYAVDVKAVNLATETEALDQFGPWAEYHTTAAPTITADAGAGPRGDTVADRIQFGADLGAKVYQNLAATNGQTYTYSVLVAAYPGSGSTAIRLVHYNGANDVLGGDLAISEGSFVRHDLTFTALGTLVNFGINNASGGSADVLVGGTQIVAGATALGLIPVGASRAALWQGNATDFPALSAGAVGDLGVTVEPDGRIVIQDHTLVT